MKRYTDTISGEELYFYKDSGRKRYFKDRAMKIRHRLDGPAVEYSNGSKEWRVNDKRHRLDGPAVEYSNGSKVWSVNDVLIIRLDKDGRIIERME